MRWLTFSIYRKKSSSSAIWSKHQKFELQTYRPEYFVNSDPDGTDSMSIYKYLRSQADAHEDVKLNMHWLPRWGQMWWPKRIIEVMIHWFPECEGQKESPLRAAVLRSNLVSVEDGPETEWRLDDVELESRNMWNLVWKRRWIRRLDSSAYERASINLKCWIVGTWCQRWYCPWWFLYTLSLCDIRSRRNIILVMNQAWFSLPQYGHTRCREKQTPSPAVTPHPRCFNAGGAPRR